MNLLALIILFSLVGGVFSLVGAFVLLRFSRHLTERILIHLVTFSAGALLGAALLNILPEAFHEAEASPATSEILLLAVLVGIVAFFILERILLRFHSHEEETHTRRAPLLLVTGDSIHNFLDGVAITASFLVSVPLGIITALAVAAHEVPSEIGEFSVMLQAGWQKTRVFLTNIVSALMTTVGALTAYGLRERIEDVVAVLLAFTAGVFIYIASSDLIPEIHHKTRKDKPWHVIFLLLLGIIAVAGAERLITLFFPIEI